MDATTTKHTPTPWKVITTPRKTKHSPKGLAIQAANGLIFADFHEGHGATGDEANANFIVRAVNSHAELLAALKCMDALVEACEDPEYRSRWFYSPVKELNEAPRNAKAAIAKAEGPTP